MHKHKRLDKGIIFSPWISFKKWLYKAIIIILIVLLIALLGFLGFKIISSIGGFFSNTFGMISSIGDINLDNADNLISDNIENIGQKLEDLENLMIQSKKYKNRYTGLVDKTKTVDAIKEVIKDNSSNDRKITISYKEEIISDIQKMTELTKELDKEEYLITLDYDENGYISQLNIADV